MISLPGNSRKGETEKVHQWLPEDSGGGRKDWLKGAQGNCSDEEVLVVSPAAGHTHVYILVYTFNGCSLS